MEVTGSVLQLLDDRKILVQIQRTSACGGNCHSCGSCGGNASQIVAICPETVEVGDRVLLETSTNRYFFLSFLVFFVPIFVIVAGYLLLNRFFSENMSSVGAVVLGVLSFLAVVLSMRKLKTPKAKKIS